LPGKSDLAWTTRPARIEEMDKSTDFIAIDAGAVASRRALFYSAKHRFALERVNHIPRRLQEA
jgi:hypothetical protein